MTTLADKIEALATSRTPGQWISNHHWNNRAARTIEAECPNGRTPVIATIYDTSDCDADTHGEYTANIRLILELVNNIPTILRALRERDQAVEALREIEG